MASTFPLAHPGNSFCAIFSSVLFPAPDGPLSNTTRTRKQQRPRERESKMSVCIQHLALAMATLMAQEGEALLRGLSAIPETTIGWMGSLLMMVWLVLVVYGRRGGAKKKSFSAGSSGRGRTDAIERTEQKCCQSAVLRSGSGITTVAGLVCQGAKKTKAVRFAQ